MFVMQNFLFRSVTAPTSKFMGAIHRRGNTLKKSLVLTTSGGKTLKKSSVLTTLYRKIPCFLDFTES